MYSSIILYIQAFISDSQSPIEELSTSDHIDKAVPVDDTNNKSENDDVSPLETPAEIVNSISSSIDGTNNGNKEGMFFVCFSIIKKFV